MLLSIITKSIWADDQEKVKSVSLRNYFETVAAKNPGCYPRWLSNQQAFWTIVGVPDDEKESIFCEDGTIEPHKRGFTLMPLLYIGEKLVTRNQAKLSQFLKNDCLPIPTVHWSHESLDMDITMLAVGAPGASATYTRYRIHNRGRQNTNGKLFLLLRPFQLYPPWQGGGEGENEKEGKGLGGLTHIHSIRRTQRGLDINRKYHIFLLTKPDAFGTTHGKPVLMPPYQDVLIDDLKRGALPVGKDVVDPDDFASGVLAYNFDLKPGGTHDIFIAMPLHEKEPIKLEFESMLKNSSRFWTEKLNRINIKIPESGIVDTLKASAAYSFITKDGPWLQPGSWCYDKSWIRDGGIAAVALMRLGYFQEVREFLDEYTTHQFRSGEIPCVIDNKADNPFWEGISEYDSQGQYIYAILQYYKFTRDRTFLEGKLSNVVRALQFAEELRNKRTTPEYKNNADKKLMAGLISNSYANHNYYDNLWTLKGWKDGYAIARILERDDLAEWMDGQYKALKNSVYASMTGAMAKHNIDYIPEYPEGVNFWASSIATGVTRCDEMENMPQPALNKTLDKYYAQFQEWLKPGANYRFTPEEMPIAEAFLYMGHKKRAIEFLRFMLAHRKPIGWKQWPEVVNSEERKPTIFGDMPHTWVSGQYILALMSLLVYEKNDSLVLGHGIPEEWLDDQKKVGVETAHTYWGTVTYSMWKTNQTLHVKISGDAEIPGQIIFCSPLSLNIRTATVNGKQATVLPGNKVAVDKLPAEIVITCLPRKAASAASPAFPEVHIKDNRIREAGFNTLRTWAPMSDSELELASEYGVEAVTDESGLAQTVFPPLEKPCIVSVAAGTEQNEKRSGAYRHVEITR